MKIYGNALNVKYQVLESTYLRRAKRLGRTQGGYVDFANICGERESRAGRAVRSNLLQFKL